MRDAPGLGVSEQDLVRGAKGRPRARTAILGCTYTVVQEADCARLERSAEDSGSRYWKIVMLLNKRALEF